jgi:hypothetical protein
VERARANRSASLRTRAAVLVIHEPHPGELNVVAFE